MASHMGRAASKGAGMGTTLRISAARKVRPTISLLRIAWLPLGLLARCGLGFDGIGRWLVGCRRWWFDGFGFGIEVQRRQHVAVAAFRTEYQQQVATAVQLGGGLDPYLGKGLGGVAVHGRDPTHRIARGKPLSQP